MELPTIEIHEKSYISWPVWPQWKKILVLGAHVGAGLSLALGGAILVWFPIIGSPVAWQWGAVIGVPVGLLLAYPVIGDFGVVRRQIKESRKVYREIEKANGESSRAVFEAACKHALQLNSYIWSQL